MRQSVDAFERRWVPWQSVTQQYENKDRGQILSYKMQPNIEVNKIKTNKLTAHWLKVNTFAMQNQNYSTCSIIFERHVNYKYLKCLIISDSCVKVINRDDSVRLFTLKESLVTLSQLAQALLHNTATSTHHYSERSSSRCYFC
jgi:hypothetical protein